MLRTINLPGTKKGEVTMNKRTWEETEELFAKGPIKSRVKKNDKGEVESYYIIDKNGDVIADNIKDPDLATELCVRWNKYPMSQFILRDIYTYGPIEKKNGKWFVPKGPLEDMKYVCWCCGAKEEEAHFTGCIYSVLADAFGYPGDRL